MFFHGAGPKLHHFCFLCATDSSKRKNPSGNNSKMLSQNKDCIIWELYPLENYLFEKQFNHLFHKILRQYSSKKLKFESVFLTAKSIISESGRLKKLNAIWMVLDKWTIVHKVEIRGGGERGWLFRFCTIDCWFVRRFVIVHFNHLF